MKIRVYSDLHLECGLFKPVTKNADLLVLAGDIHQGTAGVKWAKQTFRDCPVIYVAGNHEYYQHVCPDLIDDLKREASGSNVHVLENDVLQMGDFVFLGCTLWTDFRLGPDDLRSMLLAESEMSDFRLIRKGKGKGIFSTIDSIIIHAASVRWLTRELARHDPARIIVVTHHAPSPLSIAPWHTADGLSAAFASNMEKLVQASQIPLWIHGHTHYNVDYQIGRTRIFSNQHGYPADRLTCFQPGNVIEIK